MRPWKTNIPWYPLVSLLKPSIVFQQLVERHRREPVDIDAGVQQMISRLDARPEVHICVGVDVSVDHI